jgi:formate transporter
MAARAEEVGTHKARLPLASLCMLAVLAGAFVALGASFSTVAQSGAGPEASYGATRVLAGAAFSLGLVLVIVGGAELFTGNTLMVMAVTSGRIPARLVMRNWLVTYVGNFVGAVATAALVVAAGQQRFGNGAVAESMLAIARAKTSYGFLQAVALGILGNALVCLAVWLTFSARSTTDRIASVVLPITAFVACGFEHVVADMYLVPVAMLADAWDPSFPASGIDLPAFILRTLLPVTIGNVIGGAVLVAAVYAFVYRRKAR